MDSIHAQLGQLRSKLDEIPALQRLEVRIPVCGDIMVNLCLHSLPVLLISFYWLVLVAWRAFVFVFIG